MSDLTVLFTSAGRRVGLMRCFQDAAARLGLKIRTLAADAVPELSAACALADESLRLPRATDPSYSDAVSEICSKRHVSIVVPTIDTELLPLSHARLALRQLGAHVLVSPAMAIEIVRDKLATMNALQAIGIRVPKSYDLADVKSEHANFPLVAKPRDGSASKGIVFLNCTKDVAQLRDDSNLIVQECVEGPEYTVNVYVDSDGRMRAAVPHLRMEVRSGEVSKGRTERILVMTKIASEIPRAIPGLSGAFCFQAIMAADGPVVFEINARFGGGYPLAHASGARFTQWVIEERLGLPVTASDEWKGGMTMLRYDVEVFR